MEWQDPFALGFVATKLWSRQQRIAHVRNLLLSSAGSGKCTIQRHTYGGQASRQAWTWTRGGGYKEASGGRKQTEGASPL